MRRIEWSVIHRPRRTGKTTAVLESVHERAVRGLLSSTLIVTHDQREAERIIRLWRSSYMSLPDPDIITMRSVHRVRGRKYEKIFVEDIEIDLEGIYSDRVKPLLASLDGDEPEIIFTSSPL